MRKERKEALLCQFPSVPDAIMGQIRQTDSRKKAANFAVMLTWGDGRELFVRCFHRYYNGEIAERQRYVFADDGAVRYGCDDETTWKIRQGFREPVFCKSGYGYSFDNSYSILNGKAWTESCMKYSQLDKYHGKLTMEYLHFYCKHHNLEYIMKAGFDVILSEKYSGWWDIRKSLYIESCVNWKSNNLLRMLGLSRTEFKILQDGNQHYYLSYLHWRERFPKYQPDELLTLCRVFGDEHGTLERFCQSTGLRPRRIADYLERNQIRTHDYDDYLEQCRHLKYNLCDTAVSMPHHFMQMHERLTNIIKYGSSETLSQRLAGRIQERKIFEFQSGNLMICQPPDMEEIITEGCTLHHCVGGYAERHALGKLHILFIRQTDKPDVPFYTMEVSTTGKIIQVRGCRNRDPTEEVANFVEEYKEYLKRIFRRKSA